MFTFVKQNSGKIKDVSNVTLACDDLIVMTEANLSDFCQENDYFWFLVIPTVIILLIIIWKKEEIKMLGPFYKFDVTGQDQRECMRDRKVQSTKRSI